MEESRSSVGKVSDDIDDRHIWKSIITNYYSGYSNRIAVSRITMTNPSILRRFRKMNSNKTIDEQIKTLNFILIDSEINHVVRCLLYSKDLSGIEYRLFTDSRTGLTSGSLQITSKRVLAYLGGYPDCICRARRSQV